MKKQKNYKGNTVVVILVILGILVVGGIVAAKLILPTVINKTVNTAINTSLEGLNFDNAQSVSINQNLSQNEGMFLQIGINKGKIFVDSNSQGDILLGEIKYLGAKPLVDYQTNEEKSAVFIIKSQDQSGDEARLHLSQKTNGRIDIGLGAGSVNMDLTNLDIPILNIGAGAGAVDVTFSKNAPTTANLAAGAGVIKIAIYKGSGVKIQFAQGASYGNMNFGDSYTKIDNGYQTKNYSQAKVKIDLNLGQAAGGFSIKEIE